MKYPVWWDTVITIYNKFEDPQTHLITWFRHVLQDVFWKYERDKLSIGNETIEIEKTICRIPEQLDDFRENYVWIALPNYMMGEYFTLSRGDIIVRGNVQDEIDEYQQGYRSTDLIQKYKNMQGCIEIESVSLNIGTGRVYPHYLVEGI